MPDEWLDRHVDKLVDSEQMRCLDQYIAGDGSGGDECDMEIIRQRLQSELTSLLQRPIPGEALQILYK